MQMGYLRSAAGLSIACSATQNSNPSLRCASCRHGVPCSIGAAASVLHFNAEHCQRHLGIELTKGACKRRLLFCRALGLSL